MGVLQGNRLVMQEMRHRRFHPDDELVKRNGFDPRLESHVALVCLVCLVYLVCLVGLFGFDA
jgi:hypothetical protein